MAWKNALSGGVVALGPLAFEERLGGAVAALLAQVGAHRSAPVMEDDRAGREAEAPAALEQSPADVDVVAGDAEVGVEAADGLEVGLADGQVAAGEVFGVAIGEQDM